MQWCFLALGSVGSSHLCPLCRVPERIAGCAVGTRYWSIVLGSLIEREINRCGFRKSFSLVTGGQRIHLVKAAGRGAKG